MHCERITDEFGNDQIVSPAIPMHKNNEKFLEYGMITHFGRSTVEIRINEAVFHGIIGDIYVAKNGDIHFTAKSELVKGEISKAKNAAESGDPIEAGQQRPGGEGAAAAADPMRLRLREH